MASYTGLWPFSFPCLDAAASQKSVIFTLLILTTGENLSPADGQGLPPRFWDGLLDLDLESILIERMNQRLNGFSGYAKIWGVVVLDHPWTIESVEIQAWAQGEPTPEGHRQVCSALITYVAVDDQRRPRRLIVSKSAMI